MLLGAVADSVQILVAFAEVATGLAGFSGIVIVLGKEGAWSEQEKIAIWALLQSALGAIVLSILPILLLEGITEPYLAWRVSIGFLLAFHITTFFVDAHRMRNRTGLFIPILLVIPGTVMALLLFSSLAALVLGYLPGLIVLGYLVGVFWLLCVAIIWFISIIRIVVERGT
jgi:hypothetical protein